MPDRSEARELAKKVSEKVMAQVRPYFTEPERDLILSALDRLAGEDGPAPAASGGADREWAMVPRVPTIEMVCAGDGHRLTTTVWAAMLSAAPAQSEWDAETLERCELIALRERDGWKQSGAIGNTVAGACDAIAAAIRSLRGKRRDGEA